MLITFRSTAWNNITMFGDVALTLLQMMGHSGTVPGALRAGDIPAALVQLKNALVANAPPSEDPRGARPASDNSNNETPVELKQRAQPLIQLLSAAALQGCDVTWDMNPPAA